MNELIEARAILNRVSTEMGIEPKRPRKSIKWHRECSHYHDGKECRLAKCPDGIIRRLPDA